MFKPSDMQSGATFHAQMNADIASRQARNNASVAESWRSHAHALERKYDNLANMKEGYRHERNTLVNYAKENGLKLKELSQGNTVAGYTNNIVVELLQYRQFLAAKACNIDVVAFVGMPFGVYYSSKFKNVDEQRAMLSDAQRKEINLKLFCRIEWYDWCMHSDVLAKFGAILANAFLNPSKDNAHIRSRPLVEFFNEESRVYHSTRDKAMNPQFGNGVRNDFEKARFNYWVNRMGYNYASTEHKPPCPATKKIHAINPEQRLDLHLPAGRIAEKFGVNIETGEKADRYRKYTAAVILDKTPYSPKNLYL